jgi:hypothetical protein
MDEFPVSEQAAGLDDLRRQVAQRGETISAAWRRSLHPRSCSVQGVQHLPAGRQGGVDVHGLPGRHR